MNHKHKEPTSPNEKKPRVGPVDPIITMVVQDILSEEFQSIDIEEEIENNSKTIIEPTKDFLTNTAVTLADMLENIADEIPMDAVDDYDDDDTEDG